MNNPFRFCNKKGINPQGMAILYAMIIGSLLVSIGLAILNISLKEFVLSSDARESAIAFYSADSGVECAYYWDTKGVTVNFEKVSAFDEKNTNQDINCNGQTFDITQPLTGSLGREEIYGMSGVDIGVSNNFSLNLTPGPGCVNVTVKKINYTPNRTTTILESRGYNKACDASGRVERGIRLIY